MARLVRRVAVRGAGKDEVLAAIAQLKDKEAAASAKASESAAEAETEKKRAASAAPATRIAAKDAKAPVGESVLDALAKCKSAEERCAFALAHAKEFSNLN